MWQLLGVWVGIAWAAGPGDEADSAVPPVTDALPAPDVPPTGAAWGERASEVQRRWEDVDHDGRPDAVEQVLSGGSGFQEGRTCARLAANGHLACLSWADTAYSGFYGVAVVAVSPTTGNQASTALSPVCAAPDERSSAQGAMWRLRQSGPWPAAWDGLGDAPDVLLKPAAVGWRRGPVVAQTRVCMDLSVAKRFDAAFAWGDGEAPAPGWRVVYGGAEVKEVLRDERQVIFATRHALAVYDLATDQHAWFVQLEGPRGVGFKYDRWDAVQGVSWAEPGVVKIKIGGMLTGAESMRVKVPRP